MTIDSDWDNDLHRPFPANAKSNSSARWAYSRENDGELFADVQHDFANGWQARAHYSYGFGHLKQLAGVAGASEDTLIYDYSGSLQADFTDISPRSHNLTLNLDGQYALLGRKHDFNIGASASINKDTTRYYSEAYVPIDDRVGDKWLLNASYARSFSRKADGTPVKTNYPEHLFKLFASYDINDKITLGGNIHWQSRLYDSSIKNMPDAASRAAVSQRPYAVVDLMMHINLGKQTRLSLYADNVFNKSYKPMPDIHVYGTPRSFSAVLRHTF